MNGEGTRVIIVLQQTSQQLLVYRLGCHPSIPLIYLS